MSSYCNKLESKNAVIPNLLATEIIEIVEDIRKSARDVKPQETLISEADPYKLKLLEADTVRNEILDLDITKTDVPYHQRSQIEQTILKIAKDLTQDPTIDIGALSIDDLAKNPKIDAGSLAELLKLKKIYSELENSDPVNPNLLATEVGAFVEILQNSARQIQITDQPTPTTKLPTLTDQLGKTLNSLDRSKKDVPEAQREPINSFLLQIMRTKTGDPDFDP